MNHLTRILPLLLLPALALAQPTIVPGVIKRPTTTGPKVLNVDSDGYPVLTPKTGSSTRLKVDPSVSSLSSYMSVSGLRSSTLPASNLPDVITITDAGIAGAYVKRASDTTTPDNTGITLVTSSGVRFERSGNVFNVKQFGAKGDSITNDAPAIRLAINTLRGMLRPSRPGLVLYFPEGKYKCNDSLVTYRDIELRGNLAQLDFAELTAHTAITISQNYSQTKGAPRTVLSGLVITGNLAGEDRFYPNSGEYLDATAVRFACSLVNIQGVQVKGFNKPMDYESRSYIINWVDCAIRSNNYGVFFDATVPGRVELGEKITFTNCIISNNRVGVYNKLGEITIQGQSLDYNRVHVGENTTRISGVSSGHLELSGVHIENSEDRVMIVNNGTMSILGGALWYTGNVMIENNDQLILGPGIQYRLRTDSTYLVSGETPSFAVGAPVDGVSFPQIHRNLSGFANPDFADTTTAWSLDSSGVGTFARSTAKSTNSGYSLKVEGGEFTSSVTYSERISVKGREVFFTIYVNNSGSESTNYANIQEYDHTGKYILATTSVTIAKNLGNKFFRHTYGYLRLRPGTQYVRIQFIGSRQTFPVYIYRPQFNFR